MHLPSEVLIQTLSLARVLGLCSRVYGFYITYTLKIIINYVSQHVEERNTVLRYHVPVHGIEGRTRFPCRNVFYAMMASLHYSISSGRVCASIMKLDTQNVCKLPKAATSKFCIITSKNLPGVTSFSKYRFQLTYDTGSKKI